MSGKGLKQDTTQMTIERAKVLLGKAYESLTDKQIEGLINLIEALVVYIDVNDELKQ